MAANTAANSAANAQLTQPNTGALGDMFKPIVIGLGSAVAPVYGASQANSYLNPRSPSGSGSATYSNG